MYHKIWTGDIFSTPNQGLLGLVNEKFTITPNGNHTGREHFGIIGRPLFDKDGNFIDFETHESINKGVATLRFFARYSGQDIELYRIKGITMEEGIRLADSISEIGACRYGYRDYWEAFIDVISLMFIGKFPPYRADQFGYSKNDKYICTECAAYGARRIDKPIEPPDNLHIWVIPVVWLQALEEGRLMLYYKGDLKNMLVQTCEGD